MNRWKLTARKKQLFIVGGVLLFFIMSLAIAWVYNGQAREEQLKQRIGFFQKNHDESYASLFLFTDKLQSFYNQILGDRYIAEWTQNPKEFVLDMHNLSLIQTMFFNLINSHSELISFYLHNKKTDTVLSTGFMLSDLSRFPNKALFETYYGQDQNAIWLSSGPEIRGNAHSPEIVSLVAGIPNSGKFGAVAINARAQYVREELLGNNRFVVWLDANRRVMYAANDRIRTFVEQYQSQLSAMNNEYKKMGGHYVFSAVQPKDNWRLLSVVPERDMLQGLPSGGRLVGALFLLYAVMATLFYVYHRFVYARPVIAYETNLKNNLEDLQQNFLVNLLTIKHKSGDIERKAKEYGLRLDCSQFRVIVFQIDDYYNYLLTMDGENRFFMNKTVFNSIRWTFNVQYNAHAAKTEFEKIAVLLCCGEEDSREIEDTIRYLQNDIHDNCGLTVCAGVSDPFRRPEEAHIGYAQALRAVEYKLIYGKQSLIYFRDVSAKRPAAYQYPFERINQVSELLKKGELAHIERCLDDILEELISNEYFSFNLINAVFANILSGISKVIIESRFSLRDLFDEDVFVTLYSYEVLKDKKEYILKICAKVVETVQNLDHQISNKTSQMIMDYIHANYDKAISLTMLADELQMNSSYLSAFIKNQLGIRFIDYVSKLRIQKSLRLLDDNDLTIQEIAESCGYDTVHTFIRNFKKMFSMPPNEYRIQKNKHREFQTNLHEPK